MAVRVWRRAASASLSAAEPPQPRTAGGVPRDGATTRCSPRASRIASGARPMRSSTPSSRGGTSPRRARGCPPRAAGHCRQCRASAARLGATRRAASTRNLNSSSTRRTVSTWCPRDAYRCAISSSSRATPSPQPTQAAQIRVRFAGNRRPNELQLLSPVRFVRCCLYGDTMRRGGAKWP